MNSTFEQFRKDLLASVDVLTVGQLGWHPQGKWSTAEILEHLYLTYTGTSKGLAKVLSSGQPQISPGSTRQRMAKLVVVGLGYMPKGQTAPEKTRPKGTPAEELKQRIGPAMAQLDDEIKECETRFGADVQILNHFILGPLTAPQWRKFHVVHGRHHHRQILGLLERMRALNVQA